MVLKVNGVKRPLINPVKGVNLSKRHPFNKELSLLYENTYRGFSINTKEGPVIKEYMDSLIDLTAKQIKEHSKTYTVMFSLYFPTTWSKADRLSTDYFSRFVNSLKAQLNHQHKQNKTTIGRHKNTIRFIRVVEEGGDRGVHIHAVLYLNGNVIRALGQLDSTNGNLATKILIAWASALKKMPGEIRNQGLLAFSSNGLLLNRNKLQQDSTVLKGLISHYSYLCKAYSKPFYTGVKTFSRSRH